MCNAPPKFYQLCRLCLSCPRETDDSGDSPREIFEEPERNIPNKIMTCLSIMVGDSSYEPRTHPHVFLFHRFQTFYFLSLLLLPSCTLSVYIINIIADISADTFTILTSNVSYFDI